MSDQPSRSPRQIFVADHLWEAFSAMSADMGVDRDSLINQALFALARQNGYLQTPAAYRPPADDAQRLSVPAIAPVAPLARPIEPPPLRQSNPPAPMPVPELSAPPPVYAPPTPVFSAPPPVSEPEPEPEVVPPPPAFFAAPASEVPAPSEDVDGIGEDVPVDVPAQQAEPAGDNPVLVIYSEGREVDRVLGPRFLIGRGKHCDLIINSGKVSREHAAIIREGGEFFMEDLGSSNGTWFDKKRITRRRVEDGDEYFVCSEKITCRLE